MIWLVLTLSFEFLLGHYLARFKTRGKLLMNVWCSTFRKATTITEHGGRIENDSLILNGSCIRCGGEVIRVLEGIEINHDPAQSLRLEVV